VNRVQGLPPARLDVGRLPLPPGTGSGRAAAVPGRWFRGVGWVPGPGVLPLPVGVKAGGGGSGRGSGAATGRVSATGGPAGGWWWRPGWPGPGGVRVVNFPWSSRRVCQGRGRAAGV